MRFNVMYVQEQFVKEAEKKYQEFLGKVDAIKKVFKRFFQVNL